MNSKKKHVETMSISLIEKTYFITTHIDYNTLKAINKS